MIIITENKKIEKQEIIFTITHRKDAHQISHRETNYFSVGTNMSNETFGAKFNSKTEVLEFQYLPKEIKKLKIGGIRLSDENKKIVKEAMQSFEKEIVIYEAQKKSQSEERMQQLKNDEVVIRVARNEYTQNFEIVYSDYSDEIRSILIKNELYNSHLQVNSNLVRTLGTEFKYSDLIAYIQPIQEKQEQKIRAAQEKKDAHIKQVSELAKATGKKQLLKKESYECADRNEECNTDVRCTYIMPNGEIFVETHHTW